MSFRPFYIVFLPDVHHMDLVCFICQEKDGGVGGTNARKRINRTSTNITINSPIICELNGHARASTNRMCKHKKVKYKCGGSIYHVIAWCHKHRYQTWANLIFLQRRTERHKVWCGECIQLYRLGEITEGIGSCTRNEYRRQWLARNGKERPATTLVHSKQGTKIMVGRPQIP